MNQEEKYTYWLDAAEYDLQSAEAMYASGRWVYVVFMCQQAIEKLLKDLYVLYLDDNVPRIHKTTQKRFLAEPPLRYFLEQTCRLPDHHLNSLLPRY